MTVINPNSVAGINSITVASGNALSVHKSDGTLIRTITESSGISTFTSISVGSATTTNNADKSINIGLGASIYQHTVNSLSLGTRGDERFLINSTGRVGIKNNLSNTFDSNANTLCIGDGGGAVGLTFYTAAAADGSHISFTESTGSTSEGMISYYQGSYGTANDRDAMIFKTNGGERLRITSAGLVGIGTNTPVEELHITASGYAGQVFQSARTTSTDNIGGPLWHDAGGNVKAKVQSTVAGDLKFTSGGSSETARIDSSGRLLVGGTGNTESDVRLYLHNSSAAGSQIQITGSGSGTGNSDGFRLGYNGSGAQLWLFENEYLRFATNNEERLRIDASGNIGINKTSPNMGSHSTALTVSNVDSSARTAIEIEGNTSNCHAAIDFRSNGTLVSAINSRGTDRLQLCTGSSGNVKAEVTGDNFKIEDGDLVIGTSGHGIDFSATSDGSGTDSSELLADYEEGTWTPANTVGLTLVNNNTAYYVKVGKLVTVWFDISFRGYADSAQCSQIQGLPYAASSSSGYHSQSYNVWYSNTNSSARDYDDDNTLIYINGGDTTIRIWSVSGGHVRVRSWAVVDSNTGRRLRGTMTYMSA